MDIERELLAEKHRLQLLIEEGRKKEERALGRSAGHRLSCGTSHGCNQYHIDGKYAATNDKMIQYIIDREYYAKFVEAAQKQLFAVERLLEVRETFSLAGVMNRFGKGKQARINPLYETDDNYASKWQSMEYDHWLPNEELVDKLPITNRGEIVKSKSEKLIADELDRYNVPYHYEYPLELSDGRKKVIKRPDFLVLNKRTRRVYVTEHLGMMDKISYIEANNSKWNLYERNGYILGINLLFFHETSSEMININTVRRYIETYFV